MEYAGKQVRLKGDPGRKGVCTGKSHQRAGRMLLQIIFPDGAEYIPLDQIDFIEECAQHPLDLLRQGKLGHHSDFRRTLIHVRLNGRLVDLIYSMEVSNTDFYAYQFKPVLKILNSATNGILIADEVGLGKTIEASLVWTELKSRFDYRRLMVLCPAMLRDKWRDELSQRFGIEANILNVADTLKTLQKATAEGEYSEFAIICSMQGLRATKKSQSSTGSATQLAEFLEEYEYERPLIDCLIIDEAHYLRNPESKTTKLGTNLRKVAEYIVMLSATPVHLRSNDLYQLLSLLDEDTFNHPSVFDQILTANQPLLQLREALIKGGMTQEEFIEKVKVAISHPLLADNRQLNAFLKEPPSKDELRSIENRAYYASKFDTINILGHVITRTRKREVIEWRVLRDPFAEKIPLSPIEKRFYDMVTSTVRKFCARSNYFEGFLLVMPQRQMSSSMPAALRAWQHRRNELSRDIIYEDIGIIIDETEDIGPLTKELLKNAHQFGSYEDLRKNDSKFNRLRKILIGFLAKNKTEKIILFSYFRATIDYLFERLNEIGIKSFVLKGGSEIDKTTVIERFENSPDHPVLLSTEVGSEGIDLQFCHLIINYDLPWNPMKVEQRIGRIDRLGQKAPRIAIWNLFYDDTIDSRIYDRLFNRLGIFEKALGGLEPILGEAIRTLTIELLKQQLTTEQEQQRIDQVYWAVKNNIMEEEKLESEAAHLVAYGDYVINKINAARQLNRWISASDIKTYVIDFLRLNYPGCDIKQIADGELEFEITLSDVAKNDFECFLKDKKIKYSSMLVRDSSNPVKCVFENKLFPVGKKRIELINQIHPLVRFITHRIQNQQNYFYPAVSIQLNSNSFARGIYVFAIQKWTIQALQDIEKLFFTAMRVAPDESQLSDIEAEKLMNESINNGHDWFEAKNLFDLEKATHYANEYCLGMADREFEKYREDMENINEDRADIQLKTLENHLQNQRRILSEIRDNHLKLNRASLAKATEGRIAALEGRVKRRRLSIMEKKQIRINKADICMGLIKVNEK